MKTRFLILALAFVAALPQAGAAADGLPAASSRLAPEVPVAYAAHRRHGVWRVRRVRHAWHGRRDWYNTPPWHGPGVPLGDLEAYGYRPVPPGLDAIYPDHHHVAAPVVWCGRCWGHRTRIVHRRAVHRRFVSVRG